MSKITKNYEDNEIERDLEQLMTIVVSKLPKHSVSAEVVAKKLEITVPIEGDFLDETLFAARDVGLRISDDKQTIFLHASGNDETKIIRKLARQFEDFYNSVQKRRGSQDRISLINK